MTIKTLTATLLLATTLLLFTGCDSKTKTEVTQTQNPTIQPTPEEETFAEGGDETGGTTQNGGSTAGGTTSGGGSDDNTTTGSNDNNTTTSGGDTNDDNTTTNPTPAITIASLKLTINKTSLNKDETTIVKVMATYSDNSTKEVTQEVEWVVTPGNTVKVTQTTLTALYDKDTSIKAKLNNTLSNTITLDIYWEVNGHRLPPEPDSTVNNATLGGVDSNNNGVRDDVERNIYATYPVRLQRELLLDGAKYFQKIMVKSVSEAKELKKVGTRNTDCVLYVYLMRIDEKINSDDFDRITFLENKTVNTKARIQKYLDYNIALSGSTFGSSPKDWNRKSCSPEVIKALVEMGK